MALHCVGSVPTQREHVALLALCIQAEFTGRAVPTWTVGSNGRNSFIWRVTWGLGALVRA